MDTRRNAMGTWISMSIELVIDHLLEDTLKCFNLTECEMN